MLCSGCLFLRSVFFMSFLCYLLNSVSLTIYIYNFICIHKQILYFMSILSISFYILYGYRIHSCVLFFSFFFFFSLHGRRSRMMLLSMIGCRCLVLSHCHYFTYYRHHIHRRCQQLCGNDADDGTNDDDRPKAFCWYAE